MVITSINPVHSVVWLIWAFTVGIILFIVLEVDFIGIIILIVYVGAIAILFIFVIMMLNLSDKNRGPDKFNYIIPCLVVGIALIMLLIIYYPVELSYLYRPGQYFV
jgi:NADH:ubiquinone oxidoreductase subunit 6 (subunit J)